MGGEGVEPSAYRLTIDIGNGFTDRREEHHPGEVARVGVEPTTAKV